MKLERGFREVVDACATDTSTFVALIKEVCHIAHICAHLLSRSFQVNNAAGRSRSDDVSSLKAAILDYIYEDPKKGSRFSVDIQSERLLSNESKEYWGYRNIDTADHLCPLKLKDEFGKNPMYASLF